MTFSIFFSNVALDSLDFACSHIPPPRAHLLDVGLSALQGLLRTTQAAAGHRPWICVGGYNSTPADIAPLLQLFGGELVSSPNKPVGRATASLITCGREANSSLSLQQGDVDALWTCFIDTLRPPVPDCGYRSFHTIQQAPAQPRRTPTTMFLRKQSNWLDQAVPKAIHTHIGHSFGQKIHTTTQRLPTYPSLQDRPSVSELPVPGLNCGGAAGPDGLTCGGTAVAP